MTVSEVRKRYLDFFAKRGHVIIPSAPIVPENDPTTLFTSSGMQPLVPYLLGQPHPEGTRVADSQTSFRAGDIEEVGDNRHTTFFEMLGNWSFGDYFKKEQLTWFFEYLTDELGLDPQNLYVTVFAGDQNAKLTDGRALDQDTEAVNIWAALFKTKGIDAKFVPIGAESNGYETGMQDGRIFSYDARKNWWSRAGVPANMPAGEPGGPDSEVFYDFGLSHDPSFGKECHPNCDCGRFVEIGNSVFMQFIKNADDSFSELPKKNVDFGGGLERIAAATRGNPDVFLIDVFDAARAAVEKRSGKKYGDENATKSFRIILDHARAASFMLASGIKPGPAEQGYILRRLIRRAIREADRLGIKDGILPEVVDGYGVAYADQYPFVKENSALIADELKKEEDQFRAALDNGLHELEKMTREEESITAQDAFMLYTTYGFPVEMTEEIVLEKGGELSLEGLDALIEEHQTKSRAGSVQKFAGGLADHAEQTIRYHTTHHILLAALQKVLGPDVKQRGSNITKERLRIDFSFNRKLTPEEIKKVEDIVNEVAEQELPVTRTVMPKAEAEKLGAQMEFGVKYPDMVSVYSVGPTHATPEQPDIPNAFSLEFCGGPHVSNTKEIREAGKFKILKEEASSAGVRRIKAVLE